MALPRISVEIVVFAVAVILIAVESRPINLRRSTRSRAGNGKLPTKSLVARTPFQSPTINYFSYPFQYPAIRDGLELSRRRRRVPFDVRFSARGRGVREGRGRQAPKHRGSTDSEEQQARLPIPRNTAAATPKKKKHQERKTDNRDAIEDIFFLTRFRS